LKRFYYDTCVFDPMTLDALIAQVGVDRIILGSDFPVGESDPIKFLRRCEKIDDKAFALISGETACGILGLPRDK
jgi:aminocarboxymuconate-semialdehyde decarboxylase